MACALTQGFPLDTCKELHGGARSLRIAEIANVATITETAGVVTAITMVASKKFYQYVFKKEVINFKETENVDEDTDTSEYVQEVTAKKNQLTTVARNELLLLAKNTLIIIAEDNNGKYWMLGQKFGLTKSGSRESGTKFADFNGSMLTFKGKELEPFKEVDSSIIAAITAA
jgi:hypothetical protein